LNGDDPAVASLAEGIPGRRFYFGRASSGRPGAYLDGDTLTLDVSGAAEPVGEVADIALLGAHNLENALAAATAARLAGASPESIRRGLASAKALPHRTEKVAEAAGVCWVNDSKATNVAAARSAIASFDGALLVLLGGKDKGEDLSTLVGTLSKVDARVLAFGQAGSRIFQALDGHVPVELLPGGFDGVMEAAAQRAVPGTTVLLSPACSSYDMFANYEERGARFATLAKATSLALASAEDDKG
jgi:UDP-N-acetylmuramoylalanine--D-glutamate ligase